MGGGGQRDPGPTVVIGHAVQPGGGRPGQHRTRYRQPRRPVHEWRGAGRSRPAADWRRNASAAHRDLERPRRRVAAPAARGGRGGVDPPPPRRPAPRRRRPPPTPPPPHHHPTEHLLTRPPPLRRPTSFV